MANEPGSVGENESPKAGKGARPPIPRSPLATDEPEQADWRVLYKNPTEHPITVVVLNGMNRRVRFVWAPGATVEFEKQYEYMLKNKAPQLVKVEPKR